MAENPKNATSTNKCFSGILKRIICGGSLPTHPSDQFINSNMKIVEKKVNKDEENIIEATIKHPGIVARLMGLDSLPEKEEEKIISFPRSRSVNSLDYMIQFNLTENIHHRRAKTSVSFREVPNILDQEFKSEFLVFCFNDDQEKTSTFQTSWGRLKKAADSSSRKNVDKCYNNRTSIDMTKKVDVCGKQDRIINDGLEMKLKRSMSLSQSRASWGRQKKAADSGSRKNVDKCCNNIRTSSIDKTKKVDVCRKQDNIVKMKKELKAEDYPKKMVVESNLEKKKQKSKGKYVKSTKIQPLFNSAEPTPINYIPAGNERKIQLNSKSSARVTNPQHAIARKMEKPKEISNKETDYFINVLGDICRLTEEELHESSWLATRIGGNFKFEKFEDLCLYFGQEILELLLDQVVRELF